MEKLAAYLPQDRRRALAQSAPLPDRTTGSVLFADISGFTPFTASLRHAYGSRRGAEELSNHLNAVYTALIAEVERFGGSVTGFAGDAITCWFAPLAGEANTAVRAVTCAVALQEAMQSFAGSGLTIKIGVATGAVRRFAVGSAADYWVDVLAGETVNRTAVAEQLANARDIVLDEATIQALGEAITLAAWRTNPTTGQRFGVLADYSRLSTADIPVLPPLPALNEAIVRPWLSPLVYEREKTGHALLLTDFRPCVALFVRFDGIDYEADTAVGQLNQFIRPLQTILNHYQGTLIDLTFGDKGSYLYINFGALSIHEDDARRALKTALQLQDVTQTLPFLEPLKIGIAAGVMRTGAYGSPTRRHYGALADEVNVAARLMQTAVPGEILVNEALYHALAQTFAFEPHPPLHVKGQTQSLPIYRLAPDQSARPPQLHLHEPSYSLPLIGRQTELAHLVEKLDLVASGQSQLVSLVGEAGLGKSRLVAEVIRLAHGRGFNSYGGACQADGLNTPYLVWKQIWTNLFKLEPTQPVATQIQQLAAEVRRYAPQRQDALPVLGRWLDLPIPENELTQSLEPKHRQTMLHALLEDCLKQACLDAPLLILVEDLHWIDALSHDLLVQMVQVLNSYPIFFLLIYRPTHLPRLQAPRLEARPNFTALVLSPLNITEATQMIQTKLANLYSLQEEEVAMSAQLVQKLLARAEGNPFYLEELLNFLHGRGLDPRDETTWETDLPNSLHALILSRIDQLQPSQKRTMRVAAIIGRLFPLSWLMGYYPTLGQLPQVQTDLTILHELDLTLLDSTEPELTYLFKHIITHEVTYESLPFATRARLHEQLAHYLEQIDAPLDSIAHHYGQSDNLAKKRMYWRLAGDAAQANFANEAALAYYDQLLPLLPDDREKADVYLQQGTVLQRLGRLAEAEAIYQTSLAIITQLGDDNAVGQHQFALGKLARLHGRYQDALHWLGLAQTHLQDSDSISRVLNEIGIVLWFTGKRELAHSRLQESLSLAQRHGNQAIEVLALTTLGNFALLSNNYDLAQHYYEPALKLWRELGDKWGMAAILNNLGLVVHEQGDIALARTLQEESLSLKRTMGDKVGMVNTITNLGYLAYQEKNYHSAHDFYTQVLSLWRKMENDRSILEAQNNLALINYELGRVSEAQALHEEALAQARRLDMNDQIGLALFGLARVVLGQGGDDLTKAADLLRESLLFCRQAENRKFMLAVLIGVARLAVWRGDFSVGAQLLGIEATALAMLQMIRPPMMVRLYEETHTAVVENMTQAERETAWAKGINMSLEEAIPYALAYTEKSPEN